MNKIDPGLNMSVAIHEYKLAYNNAGIKPPAYRITCKEHKELVEYLKPTLPKDFKLSIMISEYYGVKIEVVMIVDPYL